MFGDMDKEPRTDLGPSDPELLLGQLGEALRFFSKPEDLRRDEGEIPVLDDEDRKVVVFRRGNFNPDLLVNSELIRENEVVRALLEGDDRDLTLLQDLKRRLVPLGVTLDATKIPDTDVFAIGQIRVSCGGDVFERLGLTLAH